MAAFKVPDMSCSHCKTAVEGALDDLPSVQNSNAEVGTVEVRYDANRIKARVA